MDGESREERDARIKALWEQLDTKKKGNVDLPALKNADNLVKDILHAADINQDGSISYEGPSISWTNAPIARLELTWSSRVLQVLSGD